MLIAMLPISYMLYKNSDFTLNVMAPLLAILTMGFMNQTGDINFVDHTELFGFLMGGIIRAVCGLCFGICAHNIYFKIKEADLTNASLIVLTAGEILLYLQFFVTFFILHKMEATISAVIMLPIPLAITFSGKSYLSRLFHFKWMRIFGTLSLYIYLNHWPAILILLKLCKFKSLKFLLAATCLLTFGFSLVCYVLVKICQKAWTRMRPLFVKNEFKSEP